MSRTHAGGVTRAVILTDAARRPDAHPWPASTPVPEWTGAGQCRNGRTWGRNDARARLRRIARRRARKGYRFADSRNL
jgi:hypothetical protein